MCGAEIWALRTVDQKYLERFEFWCWGRMDRISWTDRVRNGVIESEGGVENANIQ